MVNHQSYRLRHIEMFSAVVSDDGAITRFVAGHFTTDFEGFGKRTELLSPDEYSEVPVDFFPPRATDWGPKSNYSKWTVACVQRVHNPTLLAAFAVRSLQSRVQRGPTNTLRVVRAVPIDRAYDILEKNFKPPRTRKVSGANFTQDATYEAHRSKKECASIAMIVFEMLAGKTDWEPWIFKPCHFSCNGQIRTKFVTRRQNYSFFYEDTSSDSEDEDTREIRVGVQFYKKEKSHEFLPTHVIYLNNPHFLKYCYCDTFSTSQESMKRPTDPKRPKNWRAQVHFI